jgi:phospholipid/cholesterol/gamma-HCH transport system substrate-binding protein
MPKESSLEMKVGAFVVAGLLCLTVFVLAVSDFAVFKKGWTCTAQFRFANGLKKNAPVRLAGVDAGRVNAISVRYDPAAHAARVSVEAWIDEGVRIPKDSRFVINQLGLLGEKYLEIMPGVAAEFIMPGELVTGEDPLSMEETMKMVSTVGGKLEAALNGFNAGVLTKANTDALAVTLANVAVTMTHAAAISENIRKGEGTLGKFLNDPTVYRNLDELTADLKANPWKLFYRAKAKN